MSKHRVKTPCQNTVSEHRVKTPCQNTVSKHRVKTPCQNNVSKFHACAGKICSFNTALKSFLVNVLFLEQNTVSKHPVKILCQNTVSKCVHFLQHWSDKFKRVIFGAEFSSMQLRSAWEKLLGNFCPKNKLLKLLLCQILVKRITFA